MNIALKTLTIQNFKGIKDLTINFGKHTKISGENATGKTTIFDAVTWLLFNKNSAGTEKFEIRPLDADGNTVNFVEINVVGVFENTDTGESFTLEKTQKQRWTKHTGEQTETFTGNYNEFTVNGFPKNEREYKAFIANIIDEDHFKLLSSPTYFTSLKWKEQRDILMSLVSQESDLEFAKRTEGFEELVPELERAQNTNEIVEKWKRIKRELDGKHKEFPVRIDELSKAKVDYDINALTAEKEKLEAKIKIAKANTADGTAELRNELAELKLAKTTMESKAREEYFEKRSVYENTKRQHIADKDLANTEIRKAEINLANASAQIQRYNSERQDLDKKYFEIHDSVFDENPYKWNDASKNCPTCGRKLPDEDIANAKARLENAKQMARKKFDENKASEEQKLVDRGNELKKLEMEATADKATCESALATLKESLAKLTEKDAEIEKLSPEAPVLAGQKDYDYLVQQIDDIESKIANATNAPETDTSALELDLQMVNNRISEANASAQIDSRINELKAEQRETSQKIATAEGMLDLLDKFVKAKLESVSVNINGKFSMMNFKLYNTLLNGGIEECCEATYNGVPYSSLNNGMKICGGLDIINTLSKEFDKSVFVFTDNAESVNDYKLPEVSGQLITMSVTTDKELKIES